MLPKALLTLHSKMSGSRWVITPSWLSGSLWSLLYSSSVDSIHLFLISSAFVSIISVLYCAHLCMKSSLGISNFLDEISSLSHSTVFHYFFLTLITEESFLIYLCYSLELCTQMGISFPSSFAFCFSSLHSNVYGLLRQPFSLFAFLCLGDGLDHCLLYNVLNLCP